MIRYLKPIASFLILCQIQEYVGTVRFSSSLRNCTDYNRQPVAHGERFRPINQDACITCLCVNGTLTMCLSKLCSAPNGCDNPKQVYDKCCEFECYDVADGENGVHVEPSNVTVLEPKDEILNTTNLGLRLVASTVTSFLILALLLFMIHRLRQRRLLLMIRRINGSQMSGGHFGARRYSIDDDGSVGYLTRHDQVDFAPYDEPPPPYTFWKPPESYFPQEEAPPPYEVANNNNNNVSCGGNTNGNNNSNIIIHNNHRGVVSGPFPIPTSVPPISAIAPNLYPLHSVTPLTYSQPLPSFTTSALPNGMIPSLTQVSLHANNFQMNNLDQDSESSERHVVPLQELNVVGSVSSLNSSQSELNESQVEPASNFAVAIRSDAVYEEYQAGGMIPPLTPTAIGIPGATLSLASVVNAGGGGDPSPADAGATKAFSSGTYNVRRPKCLVRNASLEQRTVQSSPFKCRSCSDVVDCSKGQQTLEENQGSGKRCSLQPGSNPLCPDPTTWLADASETSSSSSPTYDRTTVSPTSSDSSSIDYNFGRSKPEVMNSAVAPHHLPRRTHSDTQFASRKTSSVSLTGNSASSATKGQCTKSSSLDRTLGSLRAKMSLRKKSKGPSKLRQLLGGLHPSSELPKEDKEDLEHMRQCSAVIDDDLANCEDATQHLTSGVKRLAASQCKAARVEPPVPLRDDSLYSGVIGSKPVWRAPRILYVSDGDISLRNLLGPRNNAQGEESAKVGSPTTLGTKPEPVLNLAKKTRPHSYDFADLHTVEGGGIPAANFSIKEEGTPVSGEPTRKGSPPTLATNTTDCCCSFSSGRLGSSWDSFTCTCSSRASFGSSHSSSSPSREGPASPGSLCSPVQCSSAMAEPPSSPEEHEFNLPLQRIVHRRDLVMPVLPAPQPPLEPKTSDRGYGLARSASICSETGERKHRRPRQLVPPPPPSSSSLTYSNSSLIPHVEPAESATSHDSSVEFPSPPPSSLLNVVDSVSPPGATGNPLPSRSCGKGVSASPGTSVHDCSRVVLPQPPATASAVANRVRVTIGSWKGSHESYI